MSAAEYLTRLSAAPGLSSYVHHLRVVHPTSGHQLSGTAEAGTRDEHDCILFLTAFILIAKRQPYKHTFIIAIITNYTS